MIIAFMLTGIVTGIAGVAVTLLAGWGILAAIAAYIGAGMIGSLLCLLATMPFGRGSGTPPGTAVRRGIVSADRAIA